MLLLKAKKELDIRGRANQRPEKPKITDQALWLALGLFRIKQDAGSSLWVSKDGTSRILMIVERKDPAATADFYIFSLGLVRDKPICCSLQVMIQLELS